MSNAASALAALLLTAGTAALAVLTMVNGYGLHVASWGWLVGGFVAQVALSILIQALVKD